MYSFPDLEPVSCSMSSSNCCFLTCIQISQEAGQVVWYSHLFQNFPQFVVIHTVKGYGTVSKAEIDVFWNFLPFSMIQRMFAVWSLVSLPFLKPLEHLEIHGSCVVEFWLRTFWALLYWHVRWVHLCGSLSIICIAFLRDWNENWPFPILWPLLSFPNLLVYWVQHFHNIIF